MRLLAIVIAVFCTAGCMDQDPFNLSQRKIRGHYRLEQFEGGLYYLQKGGIRQDGGGCIEGTVQRIGWTRTTIFAKRQAIASIDPDGWMIIDVGKETISGPLTESDFKLKYPDVETFRPEDAWERL